MTSPNLTDKDFQVMNQLDAQIINLSITPAHETQHVQNKRLRKLVKAQTLLLKNQQRVIKEMLTAYQIRRA